MPTKIHLNPFPRQRGWSAALCSQNRTFCMCSTCKRDAECCDCSHIALKIKYLGHDWINFSGCICSECASFLLFISIAAKCISSEQGPDLSTFSDDFIVQSKKGETRPMPWAPVLHRCVTRPVTLKHERISCIIFHYLLGWLQCYNVHCGDSSKF